MPEVPTPLRVALYLRKSRADLDAESRGEGETLSRHRMTLLQLAQKHACHIIASFEEVVSGERILDRPEMQRLLHAVRSGTFQAVLCIDLDRLGRGNMIDQGLIQDTFKSSKTRIITPRKVYDLDDDLDEEWSEFESFMARRELKIITRRLQRGRLQSASMGRSISKKPPYGYQRTRDLKLTPDPRTAPVVGMIFELAAQGQGLTRICRHLTGLGVPTPSGKITWERSSVYAILKNPVYLGHIVWGRTRYEKDPLVPSRYQRVRQKEADWLVAERAHTALVDLETYARYQARVTSNVKLPVHRQLVNPLAGLIYCGQCGKAMARQQTYHRPANRLLCKTVGCDTRSASFELVEERLVGVLRRNLEGLRVQIAPAEVMGAGAMTERAQASEVGAGVGLNPTSPLAAMGAIAGPGPHAASAGGPIGATAEGPAASEVLELQLHVLERELGVLRQQQASLHDLLEQGVYTVGVFQQRLKTLDERTQQVRRRLETVESAQAGVRQERDRRAALSPQLVDVIAAYAQTDSAKRKNELLHSLLQKVIYQRLPGWNNPDEFELDVYLQL